MDAEVGVDEVVYRLADRVVERVQVHFFNRPVYSNMPGRYGSIR